MFDKITINNFKGIKEINNFSIAPMTIMCGPNSSGKSSIIQTLLLIKQSLEDPTNEPVTLNGRYVKLRDLEHLIYDRGNNTEPILIETTFLIERDILEEEENESLRNIIKILVDENSFADHTASHFFQCSITIKRIPKLGTKNTHIYIIEKLLLKIRTLSNGTLLKENSIIKVSFGRQLASNNGFIYNLSWKAISDNQLEILGVSSSGSVAMKSQISNLFPSSAETFCRGRIDFKEKVWSKSLNDDAFERLQIILSKYKDLLQTIIRRFRYIGPLRAKPKIDYDLSDFHQTNFRTVGISGELSPYVLYIEKDKKVSLDYKFDFETKKFVKKARGEKVEENLYEIFTQWLDKMSVFEFKVKEKGTSKKLVIYLKSNLANHKVRLFEAGFGVSQLYPILLECLLSNPGEIIVLEQPEAHLHPKLTSLLADFLMLIALSKRKVILETHSEHFIYRVIRRTAEDGIIEEKYIKNESNNLQKIAKIILFRYSPNGAKIEELKYNDNSIVANWPEGFYDEGMEDKKAIVKAMNIKGEL